MTAGVNMAAVAALVGDPARANMLAAMLDGRSHTAAELAALGGVTPSTASEHLAKLLDGKVVDVTAKGRHRHFRLASTEVAQMLEGIMVVAAVAVPEPGGRATPRIAPELRYARTCYDHLAGELGVALAAALVTRGAIRLTRDSASVTGKGRALFGEIGIRLDSGRRTRRFDIRPCLDWSERRPHVAGVLGMALLDHALATGWVRRQKGTRALLVDEHSASSLKALLYG